jgi:hypothetical protein
MNKVLTSIEHVTRSQPCQVVFSRFGQHHFGGKLRNFKYTGKPVPAPIHHFLTIDTEVSPTPVLFEKSRYLPLIYPLGYSMGGGEIKYRIVDDATVEIVHLSEFDPEDPPYIQIEQLPERRASLRPMSYAERRILGTRMIGEKSLLDRWRMKRLWDGQCFRVAGIRDYIKLSGPCSDEDGKPRQHCDVWIFARFPATKIPFGDIWYEYSWTVDFCFGICFECGCIHAFNQCD